MAARLALLLPLLLLLAGRARAGDDPDAEPLEARVNRAIDTSAASLVRRQAPDGSWNKEDKVHPWGRTALCTFALLHAGYPKDHPAVRKALAFLGLSEGYASDLVPHSTYEAGCLALLLNALGKGYRSAIHGVCGWLCDHFNDSVGLWGYPDGIPDLSNTQYAALALKAGERHGFEAPKKIWKRLLDSVLRLQHEDGGIRYRGGSIYRATMTHAGLLVLRFSLEGLGRGRAPRKVEEAMAKAAAWLEAHYDVEKVPFGRGWHHGNYYYYMYGLERYAVFFGLDTIAGHDWYREGAEALLARQHRDGSWGNLEDTAFAILFLRRATLTEPEARDVGEGGPEEPAAAEPAPPRPDGSVPFLQEWLIAGPFPGTPSGDDHLFLGHVDPEHVVPREGGKAGRKRWVVLDSPDPKIEIGKALGGEMAWASFYAALWIHADRAQEAHLWIGSDDGLRVWQDGVEVLYGHHHDYCGDDFYRVPLKLPEGRSLLLIQVENLEYYVYFRARLTDPEGHGLSGVETSTRR